MLEQIDVLQRVLFQEERPSCHLHLYLGVFVKQSRFLWHYEPVFRHLITRFSRALRSSAALSIDKGTHERRDNKHGTPVYGLIMLSSFLPLQPSVSVAVDVVKSEGKGVQVVSDQKRPRCFHRWRRPHSAGTSACHQETTAD